MCSSEKKEEASSRNMKKTKPWNNTRILYGPINLHSLLQNIRPHEEREEAREEKPDSRPNLGTDWKSKVLTTKAGQMYKNSRSVHFSYISIHQGRDTDDKRNQEKRQDTLPCPQYLSFWGSVSSSSSFTVSNSLFFISLNCNQFIQHSEEKL